MQPGSCRVPGDTDSGYIEGFGFGDDAAGGKGFTATLEYSVQRSQRIYRLHKADKRYWVDIVTVPRPRSRERRPSATRRTSSSSRTSSADPPDEPEPEPPGHPWAPPDDLWRLTWADRLPLVWRFRDARCRILEIREALRGMDR